MISRKKSSFFTSLFFFFILKIFKFFLCETFTLDYPSNKFSFANFHKNCLDKFENISEKSFILNNICINKQSNDSNIFCYT